MRTRASIGKVVSLYPWAPFAVGMLLWLALLAFIVPYDPDEAVYKIVAEGLVNGQWPYRDLFDHKGPLTYVYYLPAGLGASIEVQRLIAAATVAMSFPALASVASTWLGPGHVKTALAAYALLLSNPFVMLGANTEAFMLLPLTAAVATRSPFAGGVFLGVAVMTKPVALAFLPVLILQWRRRAWMSLAAVVLVVALVSATFAPVWRDYWDANVVFNMQYGAHVEAWRRIVRLFIFQPFVALGMLPIWYLAARGAHAARDWRCLAWLGCAYLSVKLGGYDFRHYYALLSPPAALLAASGMSRSWHRSPLLWAFASVTGVLIVSGFILGVVTKITTGSGLVGEVRRSDGELYVLGDRSQIYVESNRRPQRRFFYSVPLVVHDRWGQLMREELLSCPPDVLVVPTPVMFPVDWADDVAALYGNRVEFAEGMVYREPNRTCRR